MSIQEKINEIATIKNAKEYEAEQDKFVFCIELLEISAHHPMADEWVNALEDIFDEINAPA